jgi:hypothetical protein
MILLEDCAMSLPLRLGADASEKKIKSDERGTQQLKFRLQPGEDFGVKGSDDSMERGLLDCGLLDYLSFYGDQTREFYGQTASYVDSIVRHAPEDNCLLAFRYLLTASPCMSRNDGSI